MLLGEKSLKIITESLRDWIYVFLSFKVILLNGEFTFVLLAKYTENLEDVSWYCPFNKKEIPVIFYLSYFGLIENACLKAHNDRRALHGAGPLIWDDTLVQQAQVWTDHLAATAKMRHDPDLNAEGENLAWFQGHLAADCADALVGW